LKGQGPRSRRIKITGKKTSTDEIGNKRGGGGGQRPGRTGTPFLKPKASLSKVWRGTKVTRKKGKRSWKRKTKGKVRGRRGTK